MILYNDDYNSEILALLIKFTPQFFYTKIKPRKNGLKTKYDYLYQYISKCTNKFLNKKCYKNFNLKVFWVLNKLQDFPLCLNDNKPIYFKCNKCFRLKIENGKLVYNWPQFCSTKCSSTSELTKQKVRKTNKKLYGTEAFFASITFKQKTKQSNKKKYGKEFYAQTDDFKIKTVATNLKNLGVAYPMQSQICQNKAKKTNIKNLGVEHPMQNYQILQKANATYIYNDIKFRTSIEIAYYIWLTDNNITFLYQPKQYAIKYFDKFGTQHIYYPDFYLVDTKQIIELKGDNHFKNGKMINISDRSKDYITDAKYQCMKNNNVTIILQSEMTDILKYCAKKYNSNVWYQQFRK